ncbi:MAG: LacI family DNA-binding transcriptional regulator [Terriglobia bacterium]
MAAGMKEVAHRAKVSVTTVSHVLNKTRHVAPETETRIRRAIEELGYYKNAHARRLARGHSDFFGLIVSDICNPFFPEIIKSFETVALEKGKDLFLCNTNYEPHRTRAAVRRMIENQAPGVAVMTSEMDPDLAKELAANEVAVVFLDVGEVKPWMSNIRVNYSRGISQAILHLRELGHQDFAFISGPKTLRSANLRRNAFIETLESSGLSSQRTLEGNHRADGGAEAARLLLSQPRLPTAILCSNDLTAIGVLQALGEAGVDVPGEVSVVGFDDIDLAHFAQPPLTTAMLSREELGRMAFKALQRILTSKNHMGAEYVVDTQLVIRKSTAQARNRKTQISLSGS